MKKLLCIVAIMAMIAPVTYAQVTESTDTVQSTLGRLSQDIDLLKRIKISGYIQTQFQYADSSGQRSFGGGDFPVAVDKRFQLRRGRLKVQYDAPVNAKGFSTSQYVLQFDVTEKGVNIKDAYVKITDPWSGWVSLTAGMQNRPFGYEITYSSSMRESPERGRMSQIIFPNERDLGAMVTIQGPKTSNWNWIKLEAGMFNGTGAPDALVGVSDFDKFKDFIGRLGITRSNRAENIKYGLGVSYYMGGYRIDSVNVYGFGKDTSGNDAFVVDAKAVDNYNGGLIGSRDHSKRNYLSVDAQFNIDWAPGLTTLRAEYIMGEQPGVAGTTKSTNAAVTTDIYKRNFDGMYFYFLQNILNTPLQLIVKYDWYDPNTDAEGDALGKAVAPGAKAFGATDVKYETLGLGLAYRWDSNVKITAYYDNVKNETSNNLSGYTQDIRDDLFTLRLQVKF
ncbi:MAG: porin [Bacteroidota bacterium]